MTEGTSAGMVARGSDSPDAAAAKFDQVEATPHRLGARYVFDIEGVATMGGMLESTLRADLRLAMGYALDQQILNGDGTGANVSGLINQLDLDPLPSDTYQSNQPNAVINWARARAGVIQAVDGQYVRNEGAWRILWGKQTYDLLRGAYYGDDTPQDAIQAIGLLGAAQRQSFQIAAPATATVQGQGGASTKKLQSALFLGVGDMMVAPVWQGITLIRDPYTEASKGQVIMTAQMLFDFIIRRKSGLKKYAIRTEA